ncbi:hypothetical protein [Nocardiopsis protaetiae]|uniref:hypothetical protein n=1 Tax=Nocardiopsis protaetiae TaxID=3382270 RepID=UPI00387AF3F2
MWNSNRVWSSRCAPNHTELASEEVLEIIGVLRWEESDRERLTWEMADVATRLWARGGLRALVDHDGV